MKRDIYTLKMLQQFSGTNNVSGLEKLIPNRDEESKRQGIEAIRQIAEFYHLNGRYPSAHSRDLKEKKLGKKRTDLKRSKKKKGSSVWYPEYERYSKSWMEAVS
jgi:hypothetical protein